ncbi:hypothetical protein IF1G_05864 [Cordyceps javanica]|uniref:Uncharacterized protein n=1 Tax=Cordyceps javanica TaxID=43265 RepID=A0A545V2U0_9HYPO|nr:hypothetical protein IF1G_05864 [Cordyceps javanica]
MIWYDKLLKLVGSMVPRVVEVLSNAPYYLLEATPPHHFILQVLTVPHVSAAPYSLHFQVVSMHLPKISSTQAKYWDKFAGRKTRSTNNTASSSCTDSTSRAYSQCPFPLRRRP